MILPGILLLLVLLSYLLSAYCGRHSLVMRGKVGNKNSTAPMALTFQGEEKENKVYGKQDNFRLG